MKTESNMESNDICNQRPAGMERDIHHRSLWVINVLNMYAEMSIKGR